MAWFRNKQTGLVWEVTGELAERLARSADYEEVDGVVDGEAAVPVDNPLATDGDGATESQDKPLSDYTVAELTAYAAERGINLGDAKRKDEIVSVIEAAEKES